MFQFKKHQAASGLAFVPHRSEMQGVAKQLTLNHFFSKRGLALVSGHVRNARRSGEHTRTVQEMVSNLVVSTPVLH